MTRLRADALLLLAALIWGTAFVAQKTPGASEWPLLFVALRFGLSAALLAPLALHESQRKAMAPLQPGQWRLAATIGLCLAAAATLQQRALTETTASNGGFLTAVYVAFVPFVVWSVGRHAPRGTVLLACAITVCGAWLLAGGGSLAGWRRGDLLILASDVAWALQITLAGRFLAQVDRPLLLSFVQYLITALVALACGLARESLTAAALREALPALLYAGIVSGGIAFTLQLIAQRHAPAAEAALIMSLESVFAALAGALLLGERLRGIEQLGCALILLGAVLVELEPVLRRRLSPRLKRAEQGENG